ncbi:palmitoyltransferase app [Anaeramoeba flamelloides]|uniref:Palmitoyltransferase n=1 Tax=Anaeramoeba flamelloides TaxID=1746091 RepID=A0AAV8A564_9EUKA|nr:palmitoyltransferase app [Anaeramoeba flamelloides]
MKTPTKLQRLKANFQSLKMLYNKTMRRIGFLLVYVTFALILYVAYLYFSVILPLHKDDTKFLRITERVYALCLFFSIFELFFKTVSTKPGTPPRSLLSKKEQRTLKRFHENQQKKEQNPVKEYVPPNLLGYRWCSICQKAKPPRTRHDKISNSCVLRLDHYCVRNFHFFLILFTVTKAKETYSKMKISRNKNHLHLKSN